MPDRLDEARRALEGVPAPDLWSDVEQRAAAGATVMPIGDPSHRHPRRWLAAAGVAAATLVGVALVLQPDDETPVETAPAVDGSPSTTIVGSDGCFFGLSGDPILTEVGPADPPLFDPSGQPAGQTIVHASLGEAQVAEIHVPGLVVTDLVGEEVDDVELERGTAQAWFGPDFVQVRWFTGSQEPCDSFTVTVAGGTRDGNRHAAVDLADRILLPDDLGLEEQPPADGTPADTLEGEWQLERSEVDGSATKGPGLLFTFADGAASWTDGCNEHAGRYQAVGPTDAAVTEATFSDVTSTAVGCPANPTADAVSAVMGADAVEVSRGGELLVLSAGDTTLVLRPRVP
jgi:hypothetical protein